MARNSNYYRQILIVLERIYKFHPTLNIGKHLATAIDDSDLWGMSDKELLLALKKYEIELNIDNHDNENIEEIIKGGVNLNKLFLEEEEEE